MLLVVESGELLVSVADSSCAVDCLILILGCCVVAVKGVVMGRDVPNEVMRGTPQPETAVK